MSSNTQPYLKTEALDYDVNSQMKIYFGKTERKKNIFKRYVTNKISTTKYNLFTFFPKCILMQFRRLANVYFLIISILTFMSFSPKNPVSMIGTFSIVLLFTMAKEAYEDFKRYRQDKEINQKKSAKVLEENRSLSSKFDHKYWEDITVGDLVYIEKDEDIPADLLLLKSSLETGMCFVDTMNLDGETNLKEKMIPPGLKDISKNDIIDAQGYLICNLPDENLEKWECSLNINKVSQSINCSLKQLMLRGCCLKNTEWIIGLVVYTGPNTKIFKNSKSPPIKVSNVMRLMNRLLYSLFFFQLILCLFFSILFIIWQNTNNKNLIYLEKYNTETQLREKLTASFKDLFLKFFTFLVAYSHLIPISLYVALEIVKLIQSILILYDEKSVDPVSNKPAIARTSDLIEELGQVEFIFSDKTGTLTKNEMEFRKCYINYSVYGEAAEDSNNAANSANYNITNVGYTNVNNTVNGSLTAEEKNNVNKNSERGVTPLMNSVNGDTKAFNILTGKAKEVNKNDKAFIEDFFTILSVCHSAYIDYKNDKKIFQSSSPDEVALLEGAKMMGFDFCNKTSETIEVKNFRGENQIWELVLELPFDSTRKRMSVIVKRRDVPNSDYFVFCKGADTAMLKIIEKDDELLKNISYSLLKFAKEGLRTLVIAKKTIPKQQVEEILAEVKKINMSNKKDKTEDFLVLYNQIEQGFNFIGSSAIEDKLQDGVPETIELLMKADIKLWVLTGDKRETAIEIGKSCRLILDESLMDSINLASDSDSGDTFEHFRNKFEDIVSNFDKSNYTNGKKLYMIIDGSNLAYVLADRNFSKQFFRLGMNANSVICCRVSPKQKSLVVKLAKDNGKWITLSIGDGANDVPMIMEAHIGVGIIGKEGSQANRSADYAIGQFRFLQRLILVHGRWGYRRISLFICYYFYKNIVTVFTELYFAIFNGFSGQIYFPDLLPLCYNAFWTSWPCIFNYSIEKDVDEKIALKNPKLYNAGQKSFYFNMRKFWLWISFAFVHGFLLFFCISFGLANPITSSGRFYDHWLISTLTFSSVISVVTIKIFIDAMYWNTFNIVVSIMSILFYYICMFLICSPKVSTMLQNELILKLTSILFNYQTFTSLIFIPLFVLLPDLTYKFIQNNFCPNPIQHLINTGGSECLDTREVPHNNPSDSMRQMINDDSNIDNIKSQKINVNFDINNHIPDSKNKLMKANNFEMAVLKKM